MVCNGIYLFYGYKLREDQIRKLFEGKDFKKFCKSLFEKENNNNFMYSFNEHLFDFETYVSNIFIKKYKNNKLSIGRLRCCAYEKNTDWIIGISFGFFGDYDLSPEPVETLDNILQYLPVLTNLCNDYKLTDVCDGIPRLYSIPNDCQSCT